jgi:hypothetical protein
MLPAESQIISGHARHLGSALRPRLRRRGGWQCFDG